MDSMSDAEFLRMLSDRNHPYHSWSSRLLRIANKLEQLEQGYKVIPEEKKKG